MLMRAPILLSLLLFVQCRAPMEQPDGGREAAAAPDTVSASIVFIGDTQTPMWTERLTMAYHRNERATEALLGSILADSSVEAVFHLGDLASSGADEEGWERVGSFADALRGKKIPFYPTPGNHEYMFPTAGGMKRFRVLFPEAREGWYLTRSGGFAVIQLNSNISNLSENQRDEQLRWYARALDSCDALPDVKAVIVACHHSPYTNSRAVSPSDDVQEFFIPPFLRSRKAIAFVSGHAHTAEHFFVRGKHFFVSGGGGGLLQPLDVGADRKWADLFPFHTRLRWFNYLRCSMTGDTARFEFRMLDRTFSKIRTVHETRIGTAR
jgi:hypothetical protein